MFKKIIILSILVLFIADIIYKNAYEKKQSKPKINSEEINPKPVNFNKTSDDKPTEKDKIKYNKRTPLNNDNEEEVFKDTKKENDEDDSDEFEGKLNNNFKTVRIYYDNKSYQTYHNKIVLYLKGNYTSIDIVSEEYPLDGFKFFFTKFIQFGQIFLFMALFSLKMFKKNITFISEKYIDMLNDYSFILTPVIFAVNQILLIKFGRSHAFEVYIDNRLKYSAIEKGKVPSYEDFVKIFKNLNIQK